MSLAPVTNTVTVGTETIGVAVFPFPVDQTQSVIALVHQVAGGAWEIMENVVGLVSDDAIRAAGGVVAYVGGAVCAALAVVLATRFKAAGSPLTLQQQLAAEVGRIVLTVHPDGTVTQSYPPPA